MPTAQGSAARWLFSHVSQAWVEHVPMASSPEPDISYYSAISLIFPDGKIANPVCDFYVGWLETIEKYTGWPSERCSWRKEKIPKSRLPSAFFSRDLSAYIILRHHINYSRIFTVGKSFLPEKMGKNPKSNHLPVTQSPRAIQMYQLGSAVYPTMSCYYFLLMWPSHVRIRDP